MVSIAFKVNKEAEINKYQKILKAIFKIIFPFIQMLNFFQFNTKFI